MNSTWITRITVATGVELEIEVGPWTNIQRMFARGARHFLTNIEVIDGKTVRTTKNLATEYHYISAS